MPSEEARQINEMFKNMPKGNGPRDLDKEREENRNRPKPPLPEGVTLKELDLAGIYAELIEKEGNNGPLVMYIHGGGFKTGDAQERREITYKIVDQFGSNVIANNYRLCPENKWPAPLEDCVAAYREIIKLGHKPENIVIMGESAGAALVLGTLLFLRDNNLPLPMAGAVYSAPISRFDHFESHYANIETDYMLGDAIANEDNREDLFGNGPEAEELSHSPYISPYFADVTGIPPIYIAVSDIEALYDDSIKLKEKLDAAGVENMLHVGHELIHAYPIFAHFPESVETLRETFEFINKNR